MLAYIDPGQGFVVAQQASVWGGLLVALLSMAGMSCVWCLRISRRYRWWLLVVFALAIGVWLMMRETVTHKKTIVLGVDAMDPRIAERLMDSGSLPAFARLRDQGAYRRQQTTIPSESAVAWTSFFTGLNPGSHGIFDFIQRNAKDQSLFLTLSEIVQEGRRITAHKRYQGTPFWDVLSKRGIPSYVYFCPNTFPPSPLKGKMFSGMGVPDITGTMGKFSFYTTRPLDDSDKESRGRIIHVSSGTQVQTELYGPMSEGSSGRKELTVPLRIRRGERELHLDIGDPRSSLAVQLGTWSPWVRVRFHPGFARTIDGIVRFYVKAVQPDLELYVTPVNFDPRRPFLPVSYPSGFASSLARDTGLFYTQGMPHDTWALSEGRIDEKAYVQMADTIFEERQEILFHELKDFRGGFFFFYFDTLDMVQHMFWRYNDKRHPLYENDPENEAVIGQYYQKIDRMLQRVMDQMDKDTLLIVVSDHGFASFKKAVHLNRWLAAQGVLSLKRGVEESGPFFEQVDWTKTSAYALGFGGIYLNRAGREYYGTVVDETVPALKGRIKKGLLAWKDPASGESIVSRVYDADEAFQGRFHDDAPDLFVGFSDGYRVSWQTALGAVPATVIEENRKKWSGDHLIDPALVPGVFFVNRRIASDNVRLIDNAPSIVSYFGCEVPSSLEGRSWYQGEKE